MLKISRDKRFIQLMICIFLSGIIGKLYIPVNAEPNTLLRKILFVSNRDGNDEVYSINADGSDEQNLTNNQASDNSPVWSSDGKSIVFTSNRDGNYEIYIMTANGESIQNLTNNSANDWLPSWSPEGKSIAFVSDRESHGHESGIYVMNSEGKNLKKVGQVDYSYLSRIMWSKDNIYLAIFSEQIGFTNSSSLHETVFIDLKNGRTTISHSYMTDLKWSLNNKIMFGECGIFLQDSIKSDPVVLEPSYSFKVSDDNFICISQGDWSPDALRIAFSVTFRGYNEGNQAGVYMMDSSGSHVQQLTTDENAYGLQWSYDEQYIVYVSEDQLFIVNVENKAKTLLTDAVSHQEYPQWRP